MRRAAAAACALLAASALSGADAPPPLLRNPPQRAREAPGFIQNDPFMALSLARTSNQLLLIDFYSPSCAKCLRLHEGVIGRKQFLEATRGMTKVAVDADAKASWEWRERFNIPEYPVLLVADAKLQEIGRLSGYSSLAGLLRWAGDQQALMDEPIASALKNSERGTPQQMRQRRLRLGLWHFQRREWVQSIRLLDGLGEKAARKHELLARRRLSQDDKDEKSAELALRLLLEEFTDDPDYGVWLGDMFPIDRDYALKHLDQARRMLAAWRNSGALEFTPWEPGDLYELEAVLLERADRPEEARRVYQQAAAFFEVEVKEASIAGAPGATARRAALLRKAGLDAEADALREAAVASSSGSASALLAFAQDLHARKDDAKAYDWVKKAEDASYGDGWLRALLLRADVESALGREDDARGTVARARGALSAVGRVGGATRELSNALDRPRAADATPRTKTPQ